MYENGNEIQFNAVLFFLLFIVLVYHLFRCRNKFPVLHLQLNGERILII